MKRMVNRYSLSLLLLVLFSSNAFAQASYTLDDCIREALQNNARIKIAHNNRSAAEHARQQARTNFFPTLSASAGGFVANKGLLQAELQPGAPLSMLKDGIVGGISASLPIFAGGQIVNGNKLAETALEISRLQCSQSEDEVRLATENYFWQIVLLQEKQATLAAVEQQTGRIEQDAAASVEAGIIDRNELLQAQLRRNELRSERIRVENALSFARNLLAQHIGHPGDSLSLAFSLPERLPDENPADLYVAPEAALAQTDEYRLLQQRLRQSRLQYKISVGKNLPSLAVGGGYMYDNLMDRDHPFWVGFATVSVPISGWWSGSHGMKRQKLQIRNAEYELSDRGELLILRMRHAWDELNDAYRQIGIALESIRQARENLRLNEDFYAAGTSTMSNLLDAQALYRQSRDRFAESFAAYEIKKREYLQATGRKE